MKKKVNSHRGEDPIDLKEVFAIVVKNWYLFLVFLPLFAGLGYIYLKSLTPQYAISSTVVIRESERSANENSVISELENYKSTVKIDNEIEKFKSKSLLLSAIVKNKAFIKYFDNSSFFTNEIEPINAPVEIKIKKLDEEFSKQSEEYQLRILNSKQFQLISSAGLDKVFEFGQTIRIGVGEVSFNRRNITNEFFKEITDLKIQLVNPQFATEQYSKSFQFEIPSVKSSTLYISFLDSSPKRGKKILNDLISGYNTQIFDQKNETAQKTISFLDERLAFVKGDLEGVEQMAEDFKVRNQITDISMDSKIYLESTAETRKQIVEVSSKLDILESIETNIISQANQYDLIPSGLAGIDAGLSEMLSKYNDLLRERQRILRSVQAGNPQLLSLNDQIENIRSNILANIRSLKSNLQINRRNYESTLSSNNYRAQRIPAIERELMEIDRQKNIKQEHYQYLLKKREESSLALEITGVNSAEIIDVPIASLRPVKPNKMVIMGGSTVFGLFLPLLIIFIKVKFVSKVTSKRSVEKITGIPVLGEIAKNEEEGVIAITPKSVSPPAEQLRLIRNNLKLSSGALNKTISITSSMSKEGKTFFSINLATCLSLVDKKVVILDLDLRRPNICKSLNLKPEKSLNDYLKKNVKDLSEIITPSGINENLDIVGLNRSIENPSEIINSYKITEVIEGLKERYDHVIIDTSPIGLVADAYALSSISDLVIFVVRMNYTKVSQLQSLAEIIDNSIFKQNFVVLNDSEKLVGSKFGYGYYTAKDRESVVSA